MHALDATAADLTAAARAYEAAIAAAGGLDLALLGVGRDGHIAFNEPTSSLGSRTRVKTLADETRAANQASFGADPVPRHALTMGVATILVGTSLCAGGAGDGEDGRPSRAWSRAR